MICLEKVSISFTDKAIEGVFQKIGSKYVIWAKDYKTLLHEMLHLRECNKCYDSFGFKWPGDKYFYPLKISFDQSDVPFLLSIFSDDVLSSYFYLNI